MIIYLDVLICLNLIINYCFIKLIYLLFNEKVNLIRIVLPLIFSIVLLFSFLLDYVVFNIIKIIGGLLIVLIAFKYNDKKRFVIMTTIFYLLQFSFIGVLSIFNVKGYMCLVLLILIVVLALICSKKSIIYNKKTYKIIIEHKQKNIELIGFVDTGNIATYNGKPIVFLDNKYISKEFLVDCVVPIKTINSINYVNCYKVDKFYIINNNKRIQKDVLIAFTKFDNDINCLLNNLLVV